MYINGPSGKVADITPDFRLRTLSLIEPLMHGMAEAGKAWTVPITAAASITDTPFFFFNNLWDVPLDFHALLISSSSSGLATVEYGRTYTSGGTSRTTVAQLNTLSANTPTFQAYYGTLVLAGTNTDVVYARVPVDTPIDLLAGLQAFQVFAGGIFAVRFKADAGTPTVALTSYLHGPEPWSND
jgi:hypothetical protein